MITTDKINNFSSNKPYLLLDDVSQLPSCYLAFPAQEISAADLSFLVNHGRGLVFAAMSSSRAKQLGLNYLAPRGSSTLDNMTVSVEARYGVSTGISSADRATTLQVIANTKDPKLNIVTPGHIFPLVAKSGGVLVKTSAVELAVDLCLLSKQLPVCAITQCLDNSGNLLDLAQGKLLAEALELNTFSITEMVNYRLTKEHLIELVDKKSLKDNVELYKFKSTLEGGENHFALTLNSNNFSSDNSVLVRVQSEDLKNDVFSLDSNISKNKIDAALSAIKSENCGAFVYIRHPKRTKNLNLNQLHELGIGAQLLKALGIKKIRLLSTSDKIISGIQAFGIDIEKRISI